MYHRTFCGENKITMYTVLPLKVFSVYNLLLFPLIPFLTLNRLLWFVKKKKKSPLLILILEQASQSKYLSTL
jgi:hypothetical protein